MAGHVNHLIMNTNNLLKSDAGFRTLSHEEQFETYGGWAYKGPVPVLMWVELLIDKLKNR
jgi:hypothetical protein